MNETRLKISPVFSLVSFPKIDSKVILAIRRAEHLKRLVYVACNAKAAMNNFIEWVCGFLRGRNNSLWFLLRPVNTNAWINFHIHITYIFEKYPILWNVFFFLPFYQSVQSAIQQSARSAISSGASHGCGSVPSDHARGDDAAAGESGLWLPAAGQPAMRKRHSVHAHTSTIHKV